MSNAFFKPFLESCLKAEINLPSVTVKALLIDTDDYTFSSAHQFLSDVAAGARIAEVTLGSKTVTDGVFDAADAVFTGVTGDEFEAVILYIDTGVEGTSRLICYLDTGTGFPLTPDGGNINLTLSNGASKIFAL